MEFFRIRRDIPFMKHALLFNVISVITFLLAVVFLATRGLNFSIEFTGGVVIEAKYTEAANLEGIRTALDKAGVHEPQVQNFGTSRDVMIRLALKDAIHPSLTKLDDTSKKQVFDPDKFAALASARAVPAAPFRASSLSARRSARSWPPMARSPCCWSVSAS